MEQNTYSSPAHNMGCNYRFTCGAAVCPDVRVASEMPPCHVDKFRRYQPDNESSWYDRSWEDVNRISWREVFSLEEAWIYILYIIIITVLIFMLMVLIKIISMVS